MKNSVYCAFQNQRRNFAQHPCMFSVFLVVRHSYKSSRQGARYQRVGWKSCRGHCGGLLRLARASHLGAALNCSKHAMHLAAAAESDIVLAHTFSAKRSIWCKIDWLQQVPGLAIDALRSLSLRHTILGGRGLLNV
jgi:hypothetical protein